MCAYQYPKGPIVSKAINAAILAVVLLMLIGFMHHPGLIEKYYSEGFFIMICKLWHPVFNVFPFSVGDLFYIGVIIYIIAAIETFFKLAFKKRYKLAISHVLKLVIKFQIVILAFYLLWGLNYFRPSVTKRFNLQDTTYTYNDVKAVTSLLIDSANAARLRLTTLDLEQNDRLIDQTAIHTIQSLDTNLKKYPVYHPNIKPSILAFAMNYMGTSGYYNPFTSEAQINYQMPVFLKPVTACHEMSHQMGFATEDEANFIGFMAGVSSHDRLLKYSAYYLGVEEFMFAVYRKDSLDYKQLRVKLSPLVMADRKADRAYWKNYEGRIEMLTGFFYDHYLKTNNQPQGLKTYNQMVRLVMAWYRQKYPRVGILNR